MNTYELTTAQLQQIREAINEALADAADSRERGALNPEITASSYRKLRAAHNLLVEIKMQTDGSRALAQALSK